jgi:hypothetical protein
MLSGSSCFYTQNGKRETGNGKKILTIPDWPKAREVGSAIGPTV